MARLISPEIPKGTFGSSLQPTFTVGDLTVQPWRKSDGPEVAQAYEDPAIHRWHVTTFTVSEAEEWIAAQNDLWLNEAGASWAIARDHRLAGRMSLRSIDLATGETELAYWVVPEARGLGIAPNAGKAVLQWAFDHGVHRAIIHHSTVNEASCCVADKLGMTYEGTKRESVRHLDGWHDMHLHARLATD